jgi:hypothetical protein
MTALLHRLLPIVLFLAASAFAQTPPVDPPSEAPTDARRAGDIPYRYPMPAIAQTVREIQHSTQAMLLREYCADEKIPDAFVNERLALFSQQTGRAEDCRTLLDYL